MGGATVGTQARGRDEAAVGRRGAAVGRRGTRACAAGTSRGRGRPRAARAQLRGRDRPVSGAASPASEYLAAGIGAVLKADGWQTAASECRLWSFACRGPVNGPRIPFWKKESGSFVQAGLIGHLVCVRRDSRLGRGRKYCFLTGVISKSLVCMYLKLRIQH